MSERPLRVGARTSRLARIQADLVIRALEEEASRSCQFVGIRTSGDLAPDAPFSDIGEPGIFAREIEAALQAGEIDLAVHSLKDLEAPGPAGLALAAVLPREDPRDTLVLRQDRPARSLATLPPGARVGTASVRRRAFLLRLRPDLRVETVRGNVPTRLRKLVEEEFDAIVLAVAGLRRLGETAPAWEILAPDDFPPAPGQGAIAVQVRADDALSGALAARLDHPATRVAVTAERAFLECIGGGCAVPAGALATVDHGSVSLRAMICAPDGQRSLRAAAEGPFDAAAFVGLTAAERALRDGADELLAGLRAAGGHAEESR